MLGFCCTIAILFVEAVTATLALSVGTAFLRNIEAIWRKEDRAIVPLCREIKIFEWLDNYQWLQRVLTEESQTDSKCTHMSLGVI